MDIFSDLDNGDLERAKIKADTTVRFPCPECAGSGRYQGARVHQEKSHCFACRGTGYFKTDPRKLAQNRTKARIRKVSTLHAGLAAFEIDQPEMFAELRDVQRNLIDGNSFISSLAEQLFTRGSLSANQIAAWHNGKAKLRAIREAAAQERAKAPTVDLEPIREMFLKAKESGYKRPQYRAEGFIISLAPDNGRNAGHLYIKSVDDIYMGKIDPDMRFHGNRDSSGSGIEEALASIARDPKGAAIAYGQRTGRCACCGRELTKHTSIDLGIGPICAQKWGF